MTIEGVVQARLDRINPKLGAAIQACAVLAMFTFRGLAALLKARASDPLKHLSSRDSFRRAHGRAGVRRH